MDAPAGATHGSVAFDISQVSGSDGNNWPRLAVPARQAKSAYEEATADMVRAKHILIQFPEVGEGENGALTDAQKEATLAEANEVLEKVNSMADISEFDALIKEYNDDPGMETFTDGYYFT